MYQKRFNIEQWYEKFKIIIENETMYIGMATLIVNFKCSEIFQKTIFSKFSCLEMPNEITYVIFLSFRMLKEKVCFK